MKTTATLLPLLVLSACGHVDVTDVRESTATADENLTALKLPIDKLPPLTPSLKLRFPIQHRDRGLITAIPIVGMDHKPGASDNPADCYDYRGLPAPFCYNEHDGTDYLLFGGFFTMDHYDTRVVAAAAGTVESIADGNYDRCHGSGITSVSCDGNPMAANNVIIRHDNGFTTRYWHLKKGSVAVTVGQRVQCGQLLGFVGSSGHSTGPHLHFELHDQTGKLTDPYAGPKSQSQSYWTLQDNFDGLPGDLCPGEAASAVQCVWETAADAAKCGTELVTDAVKCGTSLITSAERCGTRTLNSLIECAKNGFSGLASCRVPLSCDVPNSCNVPKTCQVYRCY